MSEDNREKLKKLSKIFDKINKKFNTNYEIIDNFDKNLKFNRWYKFKCNKKDMFFIFPFSDNSVLYRFFTNESKISTLEYEKLSKSLIDEIMFLKNKSKNIIKTEEEKIKNFNKML